jgi:hypothetical protein
MRNTTKSPSISAVYLPEYIVAMAAASVVDAPGGAGGGHARRPPCPDRERIVSPGAGTRWADDRG